MWIVFFFSENKLLDVKVGKGATELVFETLRNQLKEERSLARSLKSGAFLAPGISCQTAGLETAIRLNSIFFAGRKKKTQKKTLRPVKCKLRRLRWRHDIWSLYGSNCCNFPFLLIHFSIKALTFPRLQS